MSQKFNEKWYLQSKLAQCNATGQTDANGNPFTMQTLKAAIENAGYTLESHYQKYSSIEGTKAYTQMDFDEDYYLQSKLAQLASIGETGWTRDSLIQAINKAGMTVEQHYQRYSTIEGTSCNPYFNTTEYLEAKLKQLQNSANASERAEWANKTAADVAKAIKDAGMSAEEHYMRYGCKETDADGNYINPSNAFDVNAYASAKLAELQKTDPQNWSNATAKDVMDAIGKAGLTPVSHYEKYGKAEGEDAGVDMVQTVPVVDRVANDPLRDAINDNVPSNYNAHTTAPKNVSTGASVTKPCDVADDDTVKPSDPVATPSDADYIPVPGNGIRDTNANPVELVSATTKDASGKDVTVAQYGVATTSGGNTVINAVDPKGKVTDNAIQTVTAGSDGTTTTTTNVTQGSTSIAQTAVDNGNGTVTTTTSASLNGGVSTVEQTATTTTAPNGRTITETDTTVKNADGKVVMEQSATETANASGTSATTAYETTSYDPSTGKVTGTETGTETKTVNAATGTETTKTEATLKDANGVTTGTVSSTETVSTNADGDKVTTVSTTEKDPTGKTVGTSETTTTASRDGNTLTTEVKGESTDADGNTASVNETTVATTNPTTGATSAVKTVDNEVTDKDGNVVSSEAGTVRSDVAADGSATKTTSITATGTDEDGNPVTTVTNTTAAYDPATGETKTTGTVTTTDASGKATTETVNETTTGDTAGSATTPAEDAAAAEAAGNSEASSDEPTEPDDSGSGGSDTPAADTTAPTLKAVAVDGTTVTVSFTDKSNLAYGEGFDATNVLSSVLVGEEDVTESIADVTLNASAKTLTFTLAAKPAADVSVTIPAGAIADVKGNVSTEDMTGSWTYVADETAPEIGEFSLAGKVITAPVTDNDSDLTLDEAKITVSVGGAETSDFAAELADGTLTITLDTPPVAGSAVTVTLAEGAITDSSGNASAEANAELTADDSGDTEAPVISDFALDGKVITATVTDDDSDLATLKLDDTKVGVTVDGEAAEFTASYADGTLTVTLASAPAEGAVVVVTLSEGALSDGTNSSAETVSPEMTGEGGGGEGTEDVSIDGTVVDGTDSESGMQFELSAKQATTNGGTFEVDGTVIANVTAGSVVPVDDALTGYDVTYEDGAIVISKTDPTAENIPAVTYKAPGTETDATAGQTESGVDSVEAVYSYAIEGTTDLANIKVEGQSIANTGKLSALDDDTPVADGAYLASYDAQKGLVLTAAEGGAVDAAPAVKTVSGGTDEAVAAGQAAATAPAQAAFAFNLTGTTGMAAGDKIVVTYNGQDITVAEVAADSDATNVATLLGDGSSANAPEGYTVSYATNTLTFTSEKYAATDDTFALKADSTTSSAGAAGNANPSTAATATTVTYSFANEANKELTAGDTIQIGDQTATIKPADFADPASDTSITVGDYLTKVFTAETGKWAGTEFTADGVSYTGAYAGNTLTLTATEAGATSATAPAITITDVDKSLGKGEITDTNGADESLSFSLGFTKADKPANGEKLTVTLTVDGTEETGTLQDNSSDLEFNGETTIDAALSGATGLLTVEVDSITYAVTYDTSTGKITLAGEPTDPAKITKATASYAKAEDNTPTGEVTAYVIDASSAYNVAVKEGTAITIGGAEVTTTEAADGTKTLAALLGTNPIEVTINGVVCTATYEDTGRTITVAAKTATDDLPALTAGLAFTNASDTAVNAAAGVKVFTIDLGDAADVLVKEDTIKIGSADLQYDNSGTPTNLPGDGTTGLDALFNGKTLNDIVISGVTYTPVYTNGGVLTLTYKTGTALTSAPSAEFATLADDTVAGPTSTFVTTYEYEYANLNAANVFTFAHEGDSVTLPDGTEIKYGDNGVTANMKLSTWLNSEGNGYTAGKTVGNYTSTYNNGTLTVTTTQEQAEDPVITTFDASQTFGAVTATPGTAGADVVPGTITYSMTGHTTVAANETIKLGDVDLVANETDTEQTLASLIKNVTSVTIDEVDYAVSYSGTNLVLTSAEIDNTTQAPTMTYVVTTAGEATQPTNTTPGAPYAYTYTIPTTAGAGVDTQDALAAKDYFTLDGKEFLTASDATKVGDLLATVGEGKAVGDWTMTYDGNGVITLTYTGEGTVASAPKLNLVTGQTQTDSEATEETAGDDGEAAVFTYALDADMANGVTLKIGDTEVTATDADDLASQLAANTKGYTVDGTVYTASLADGTLTLTATASGAVAEAPAVTTAVPSVTELSGTEVTTQEGTAAEFSITFTAEQLEQVLAENTDMTLSDENSTVLVTGDGTSTLADLLGGSISATGYTNFAYSNKTLTFEAAEAGATGLTSFSVTYTALTDEGDTQQVTAFALTSLLQSYAGDNGNDDLNLDDTYEVNLMGTESMDDDFVGA